MNEILFNGTMGAICIFFAALCVGIFVNRRQPKKKLPIDKKLFKN